jgi:hypothetical protein
MRQTRAEKIEQLKEYAVAGLLVVVALGVLGGWFLYFKPKLRPARAENAQHPYFMKYMEGQTKLRADFNREMMQIGWPHILNFKRVTGDLGMTTSQGVAEQAKGLVAQYSKASKVLDDEALQDLARMPGSEESRKEAQAMFVKMTAEPRKMVNRTWELEGLVVMEVEKIIRLMAKEPRGWALDENKVKFSSMQDQKEFDACLDRVAVISAEQDAVRAGAIESSLKKEGK